MVEKAAAATRPDIDFKVANGTDFHFDEKLDTPFSTWHCIGYTMPMKQLIRCRWHRWSPAEGLLGWNGGKDNMKHMIAAARASIEQHWLSQAFAEKKAFCILEAAQKTEDKGLG